MDGDWKRAKHAGRRPLDGKVRRLMEHSLLANHERQFATPSQRAARTDRPTSGKQLWTRSARRTSTPPKCAGRSRRLGLNLASGQHSSSVAQGRRSEPVLSLDSSGCRKRAKHAGRRPLDGRGQAADGEARPTRTQT